MFNIKNAYQDSPFFHNFIQTSSNLKMIRLVADEGMKNILLITGFGSGGDLRAIKVLTLLCKSYNYDVYVFSSQLTYDKVKNDPDMKKLKWQIVDVFNKPTLFNYLLHSFLIFFNVMRHRKTIKRCGIIYVPTHFFEYVVSGMLAKFMNPRSKLVIWVHHFIPTPKKRLAYKGPYLLSQLQAILGYLSQKVVVVLGKTACIDVIFTLTNYMKTKLIANGLQSEKIKVVGNGVDLTNLGYSSKNKRYDGCIVGVSVAKGTFDAIKAWSRVVHTIKDAKLVIIGYGGPYNKIALNMIKKLNLEKNVIFTGLIEDQLKNSILSDSKLFIAPFYEEGWSLAIAEAMSFGLSVIAYDDPVFREVYQDAIFYVPKGDVLKLSQAITTLLNDVELRDKYSIKSRQWAIRHCWRKVAQEENSILCIIELRSKMVGNDS